MNQNKDVSGYKRKLLQTFKNYISFCERHSLTYYCCGGTALGAIRHKGIIPWDDDIDVFMPRADFEKLYDLKKEIESVGYSVASIKDDTNYNLFMKYYDKNTTLWEIKEVPFISGVYIDIFPLDRTADSKAQFLKKYTKRRRIELLYQLSYSRYAFRDICSYYREKNIKAFKKGVFSLFVPNFMRTYLKNKLIEIDKQYKEDNGPNMISSYGDYWEKEYLDSKWFGAFEKKQFEDFEVSLGTGTHQYLSQVYGNYMQLPPLDKQVTHHFHYYLNLDRGLQMNEIMKEL